MDYLKCKYSVDSIIPELVYALNSISSSIYPFANVFFSRYIIPPCLLHGSVSLHSHIIANTLCTLYTFTPKLNLFLLHQNKTLDTQDAF